MTKLLFFFFTLVERATFRKRPSAKLTAACCSASRSFGSSLALLSALSCSSLSSCSLVPWRIALSCEIERDMRFGDTAASEHVF